MTDDPNLTPEQLALLATLNPDCPICFGENINALTSTDDRTDPCPWCNPIIEAVYGKRKDRPLPANHEPIPF